MTGLPVTSVTAAIAALMLIALSVPVSLRRAKVKALSGDAGDATLQRLIRAQGNFIEYAPMGLILLALVEVGVTPAGLLWTIGMLLIIGRGLHALGMIRGSLVVKGLGMLGTFASLVTSAFILLARYFSQT
jgi:uncharacterized membrane protein YecN with MAPEG domain